MIDTTIVRPEVLIPDSQHKLFYSLSDNELQIFKRNSKLISLDKNDVLFKEGDVCRYAFIIKHGILKECIRTSKRVVVRHFYYPEDFVCDGIDNKHSIHDSSLISLCGQVSVIAVELNYLKSLSASNNSFAAEMIGYFSARAQERKERVDRLMSDDAKCRIIHFITTFAGRYGVKIGFQEILLKHCFTQQDIADYTGTSRQTVVNVLNELKDTKTITFMRSRILIKDIESLKLALVS